MQNRLCQPFHPRQKKVGFGLGGEQVLSLRHTHAEGTLSPSVTVIVVVKKLAVWICNVSLERKIPNRIFFLR